MTSYEGSSYNKTFHVSDILFNTKKVFTSYYPYASFIFENLQENYMLIDSVTLSSELLSVENGYPLGTALIFTSNVLSSFDSSSKFDMMNEK